MSKKKNQNNTAIRLNIENKKDPKERRDERMLSIVSIVLSILALVVSLHSYMTETHYSEADYEYKRPPAMQILEDLTGKMVEENGEMEFVPYVSNFTIEIESVNNLDRVYIIDPAFQVEELPTKDVENQLRDCLSASLSDGTPDIKIKNNWYFYRFVALKALDGEITVQVIFVKTTPISGDEVGAVPFEVLNEVSMLEFEKAHLDDEEYAGERQIAAQYREIKTFLSELN